MPRYHHVFSLHLRPGALRPTSGCTARCCRRSPNSCGEPAVRITRPSPTSDLVFGIFSCEEPAVMNTEMANDVGPAWSKGVIELTTDRQIDPTLHVPRGLLRVSRIDCLRPAKGVFR